ncbi:MAG: guanylate kinase [Actinobacteria bacterium]|nr:guanylate kinase [Actinomycetota bacterium]
MKAVARIGKLFVLSGPGGVGKSTIVQELRKLNDFYFSVSATTRKPRQGEIDGVAYHFVSEEKFQSMIDEERFLEWADFAGSRYGTPKEPVMSAIAQGKNVILEIEIQGARQVKKAMPDAVMVFISPPSLEDLLSRMENRGTDEPERIAARLALAREEMAAAGEFDHILVNHRVGEVVDSLVSLAALAH